MTPLKLAFVALTLVAGQSAFAWDLRNNVKENRDSLTLSGDMSTFTLEGGTISGSGAKIDFQHAFAPRASVELFLSSAISASQGVSSSFTGYGAHLLYSPFQDAYSANRSIEVNGVSLITENAETKHLFEIGVGLNQYLLNGSKGVYSASGLDGIASYRFAMLSFQWKASARFASLVSAATPVSAIFLSIGLSLPL